MSQALAFYFDFKTQKTDVRVPKIDSIILKTYKMVISIIYILNKNNRERFFEEIFLLADIKPDVIFGMPLLIMSNANMNSQV